MTTTALSRASPALLADFPANFSATRRVWPWLKRRSPWEIGLAVLISAYVTMLTIISVRGHHALSTSTYDFTIFDQGVWLLSQFDSPFITVMGRHLLGDHGSFILVLISPIYWVFPTAGALLFVQSLAVGMGAMPIFLYARRRLGKESIALLLAAVYLLHPAVAWTNLEQFHPDAFLGVFLGFAIYGALVERWKLYTVFVVLSLLVKEDVSLIIVLLGVWVIFRRSALIGALTIVWAVSFTVFVTVLMMQYFTGHPTLNAWRIPFGGPGGLIKTMLTHPGEVFDYLRRDGRPWYMWQMMTPTAWMFFRLPDVAAIGTLALVSNVISTFWYQHQIQYHYSLVLVPPIILGTVHALGAIKRRRAWFIALVAVTALWSSYLWGTLPLSRNPRENGSPNDPMSVAAREVIDLVPDGAVVSSDSRLTPHLSHRKHIYMFPNPFSTYLYGVPGRPPDGTRLSIADKVEYVVLSNPPNDGLLANNWALVQSEFTLIYSNDYWALYQAIDLND